MCTYIMNALWKNEVFLRLNFFYRIDSWTKNSIGENWRPSSFGPFHLLPSIPRNKTQFLLLFLYLFVSLSIYLSWSIYLSICMSMSMNIYLYFPYDPLSNFLTHSLNLHLTFFFILFPSFSSILKLWTLSLSLFLSITFFSMPRWASDVGLVRSFLFWKTTKIDSVIIRNCHDSHLTSRLGVT